MHLFQFDPRLTIHGYVAERQSHIPESRQIAVSQDEARPPWEKSFEIIDNDWKVESGIFLKEGVLADTEVSVLSFVVQNPTETLYRQIRFREFSLALVQWESDAISTMHVVLNAKVAGAQLSYSCLNLSIAVHSNKSGGFDGL